MKANMNRNEITEYIDMLRDAQSKLYEALETLHYVQRCTDDRWADSYIVCPIATATDGESKWVTRDPNINNWIERLEEQMSEHEDEEDEEELDNE